MAKSHFIQQKFIMTFTKGKGIYVFDKTKNKPLNKLSNAKKIAYKKDLYKLELKDISEHFKIDLSKIYPKWNEDGLELVFKEFEDAGIDVIRKITEKEKLSLSNDEKVDLIAYLILSSKRTPTIKELEECIYKDIPIAEKEKRNIFIKKILDKDDINKKIHYVLSNYKMILLKNENDAFVFSYNWCAQFNIALPSEIFIPLTASLGILFKDVSRKSTYSSHDSYNYESVNILNNVEVVEYNFYHQIAFAQRWIYGAYTSSVVNFFKMIYPIFNAESVEIEPKIQTSD